MDVESLRRGLREEVDDALRVVATYSRDGYDPHYVRGDVEPRVAEHGDDVHEDLVLQGLGREGLESVFDAGSLHCSVHRFDEVTVFHFVDDDYTGLFVSLDSGAGVNLTRFAERCREFLSDHSP